MSNNLAKDAKGAVRQSAEEWHVEFRKGTIRHQDIKYILWDWQNDHNDLLKRIEDLEKENDQLVELAAEINKKVKK